MNRYIHMCPAAVAVIALCVWLCGGGAFSGGADTVCFPWRATITEEPVFPLSEEALQVWALLRHAGTDELYLHVGTEEEREEYRATLEQKRETATAHSGLAELERRRSRANQWLRKGDFRRLTGADREESGVSENAAFLLADTYEAMMMHLWWRRKYARLEPPAVVTVARNSVADIIDGMFALSTFEGQEWQWRRWTAKAVLARDLDHLQRYRLERLEQDLAAVEANLPRSLTRRRDQNWLKEGRAMLERRKALLCAGEELDEVAEILISASSALR